jgi:hypothetical protein
MQSYKEWKVKHDISDKLWQKVKAYAILTGKSTGEYITEALEEKINKDKKCEDG